MKVHLHLDGKAFYLPPSEALIEFFDGMAADYGDAAHGRALDAVEHYKEHGDIPRASLLINEGRRLDELGNVIASAARALRKQLEDEKTAS